MPKSLLDRAAFITGGSSGIGAALAEEFGARGAHVVICARRADRLRSVAAAVEKKGGSAVVISANVTRDEDMEQAVAQALGVCGRLDYVVANAGFAVTGAWSELTMDDYRRQFETNVFGALRTAYAAREALIESQGVMAVVGSVAGEIAFPDSSPYTMSKAAVHRWAESLWYEFQRDGVCVTTVVPGYVRSEIRQVDNTGVHHGHLEDPVPETIQMPADVAARRIVDAMVRRRRRLELTRHGQWILAVNRWMPWLIPWAVRRSMKKRGKTRGGS